MFGGAFVAPSLIAPLLITQHYRVAFEVVRNPLFLILLQYIKNIRENAKYHLHQ